MNLPQFEMERWLAQWDDNPEVIDIAASGVEPLTLDELLALDGSKSSVLGGTVLGYPNTQGSRELRSGVAATYGDHLNSDNVLITTGAAEAVFLVMTELLSAGDEVIIPTPGYKAYEGIATSLGAKVVPWHIGCDGYDVSMVGDLITGRTSMIVVNTPHNPLGHVIGHDDMRYLYDLADYAGAYLMGDEVGRGIGDDDLSRPVDFGPLGVSIGGLSKAMALPGLRVGWIVAAPEIVQRTWARRDYVTLAPSPLNDALAVMALRNRAVILHRSRDLVKQNTDFMRGWVETRTYETWHAPQAGATGVLAYSPDLAPSARLARQLADDYGILVVPGAGYGVEHSLRIGLGMRAMPQGVMALGVALNDLATKGVRA